MVFQSHVAVLLDEQREHLVARFCRKVLKDPYFGVFGKIEKGELEDLIRSILTSLQRYLEGDDAEFDHCFEQVGNACFQLSIPLLETAFCLFILKDKVVELLGQENDRAAKFFDRLVLELLRTY